MIEFEYRGRKLVMADDSTPEEIDFVKRCIDEMIEDRDKPIPAALQAQEWIDKVNSASGHIKK